MSLRKPWAPVEPLIDRLAEQAKDTYQQGSAHPHNPPFQTSDSIIELYVQSYVTSVERADQILAELRAQMTDEDVIQAAQLAMTRHLEVQLRLEYPTLDEIDAGRRTSHKK